MPLHNPVWEVAEPYLIASGVYSVSDPTYGRYLLPHHPPHSSLVDNPEVKRTYRRVFLKPVSAFPTWQEAYSTTEIAHSEEVLLTADEIVSGVERGGRWLFYSTWELKEAPAGGWEEDGRGRNRDLVLIHGLSDYGLRYAPHVLHFLRAGFRVILPDLPSYGRSTGVNSYLPSLELLPAALHTVLTDVAAWDITGGRKQRQVFLNGASLGGWTCLYYVLKFPPSKSAVEVVAENKDGIDAPPRVQIAGAFVLCPMVEARQESRPPKVVEYIGMGVRRLAGALPVVNGVRGNVSDDPRVEEDFFADPLCYHGRLRVATGLSLLDGMSDLLKNAEQIDIPIRIVHGTADRTTCHLATARLFERLPHADKQLELYDGYEHVMIKVGIDEADDEKRQRVLADWRKWLIERSSE